MDASIDWLIHSIAKTVCLFSNECIYIGSAMHVGKSICSNSSVHSFLFLRERESLTSCVCRVDVLKTKFICSHRAHVLTISLESICYCFTSWRMEVFDNAKLEYNKSTQMSSYNRLIKHCFSFDFIRTKTTK